MNEQEKRQALDWLEDAFDLDRQEAAAISRMSDEQLRDTIDYHYEGGMRAFLSDGVGYYRFVA